jgi:hypothetical protein
MRRPSAIVVAAVLAACGIDQGGIERPPDLGRLTVITGPITGFGSVHVNGLVLASGTAQIRIDGDPGIETDLRRGQVIRAIALVRPGIPIALSIEYQSNLAGPIAALDVPAGTFTVLGQGVLVDGDTVLDLGPGAALSIADRVVVSGLRAPTGEILATYVGPAGNEMRITGSITAVDVGALTFEIGDLTVDYSQAQLLQVPNGLPQIGSVVAVTGAMQIGGALVATQVLTPAFTTDGLAASATALTSDEAPVVALATANTPGQMTTTVPAAASFMGFITATAPGVVALADVEVSVNTSTAIIGDADALLTGALVLVEGRIVGLGKVAADRITIL